MLRTQAAESGKPADVLEKMVLGRLNKCAVFRNTAQLWAPRKYSRTQRAPVPARLPEAS